MFLLSWQGIIKKIFCPVFRKIWILEFIVERNKFLLNIFWLTMTGFVDLISQKIFSGFKLT